MQTPQHLSAVFHDRCYASSSRNCIISSDGKDLYSISYGTLYADVQAWAKFLREQGVHSGDRVSAISTKSPNHLRFFYACWMIGAVAVPICESLGDNEMSFVIKDCAPRLIFTEKSLLAKVSRNAEGIAIIDWGTMPSMLPAAPIPQEFSSDIPHFDTSMEDVACLIYTSGSTGMPKGVMLTHRNLWWNASTGLEQFKISDKDRLISVLPYWHAYALTVEIICTFLQGCTCCIPRGLADFSRNISKYMPSIVLVVPRVMDNLMATFHKQINLKKGLARKLIDNAIYNASRIFTASTRWNGGFFRMLYHTFFYNPLVFRKFRKALGGKIRYFVSGGAPLDLDVQSFFSFCGMPVLQGYGLSEASPIISTNSPTSYRLGSCGKVLPWLRPEYGGDYTFRNEEGEMGKHIPGQLLVRGNSVMKGYWNHTDASAKTMTDGWLNTGDVGHTDKDGYLFIHGRNSTMIVLYGGEKLHPEYIEDAVKTSSMISEAVVIGEKCKNVYVCVNVPKEIQNSHAPEVLHKLIKSEIERTTANLAPYQKPKNVLILPEFTMEDGTMTATLKVRRHKIKELYREEIEKFLAENGETNATKTELAVPSSRIMESLEEGSIIVGNGNKVS